MPPVDTAAIEAGTEFVQFSPPTCSPRVKPPSPARFSSAATTCPPTRRSTSPTGTRLSRSGESGGRGRVVDAALATDQRADGWLTKPADETNCGGYSAHVANVDGHHLWEIAHKPVRAAG